VQSFVARTDMGCGSTIGPLTAASLGVDTVDLGVPTFAMHSIRELAGADDAFDLLKVISRYYSDRQLSL
jgi:aspartyl aminopeptidase